MFAYVFDADQVSFACSLDVISVPFVFAHVSDADQVSSIEDSVFDRRQCLRS